MQALDRRRRGERGSAFGNFLTLLLLVGLIVANGGLVPNPDSLFAKEVGFQVQISMSESETWSPLNNGRLAATATTVDALAVLGRSFDAVVPLQIGYSRGADMVVVDRGIASVNQLAGKVLAASPAR